MSETENVFKSALTRSIAELNLPALLDAQLDLLAAHYEMLVRWNRHINLTRIIAPAEAARIHYAESMLPAQHIPNSSRVLDVGSGAGFPGIPLAIARPDLGVTALDSNQKKALFLAEVKDSLNLSNLIVARARFEDFDWSSYDVLVSRALDRAEQVYTSIIKQARPGSRIILMCGPELLGRLKQQAPPGLEVEEQKVPGAESRLIAVVSKRF